MANPKQPSEADKKETGWRTQYIVEQFSFCCGGMEVGALGINQMPKWYYTSWTNERREQTNLHSTPAKAWKAALKDIRTNHEHYPLMFNLVEGGLAELRQIISKEPDATMVHTWRNPNTNNVIEMWILTNESDMEYHGDDND